MKLKIRKICLWIACVQLILVTIHFELYQVFSSLNYASKQDIFQFHESEKRSNIGRFQVNALGNELPKQIKEQIRDEDLVKLKLKGGTVLDRSKQLQKFDSLNLSVTTEHLEQNVAVNKSIRRIGNAEVKSFNSQKFNDVVFPVHLVSREGDNWQPVSEGNAFVYSAYQLNGKLDIIIIGATTQDRRLYSCLLWRVENGSHKVEKVAAKVKQLPEGHKLRFSAVFFECRSSSYTTAPSHVSLVPNDCGRPENLLQIHSTTPPQSYPRRFTVCLTPLSKHYGRAYEIVEWFELNRILGAQKFIVYTYSTANNVDNVLDYYTRKEIVQVLQWRLPMNVLTYGDTKLPEIHYYGQTVALHDCLYRNKAYSEFIVNIDLDEYIIPHTENVSNWNEMLKQLDNDPGAYIFHCTFFRKEWDSVNLTNKEMIDKYKLVTLQKLNREEDIYPVKRRSKYIARTISVSQMLIHDVTRLPKRNKAQAVTIEIGLLHHYRDWENEILLPDVKVFDDTIPKKYSE